MLWRNIYIQKRGNGKYLRLEFICVPVRTDRYYCMKHTLAAYKLTASVEYYGAIQSEIVTQNRLRRYVIIFTSFAKHGRTSEENVCVLLNISFPFNILLYILQTHSTHTHIYECSHFLFGRFAFSHATSASSVLWRCQFSVWNLISAFHTMHN